MIGHDGSVGQYHHGAIPPGAVPLTDHEVLTIMNKRIANYYPSKDIWALKYGHYLCASLGSLTGLAAVIHYRTQFRLRHYAKFSTSLPTMVLPALGVSILNVVLVQQKILTGKISCPLCAEVRAATVQTVVGVAQPVALAVLACLTSAKTFHTISFPRFTENKDAFLKLIEMSKGFRVPFLGALTLSVFASMFVTQQVGKQAVILHKSMQTADFQDILPNKDEPKEREKLE